MDEIKKLCQKIMEYSGKDNQQTLDYIVNYLQLPIDELAQFSNQEKTMLNTRNTLLLNEMEKLQNLCISNNIPMAFFKGLYEAYDLYRNPISRISCDIDLLVPREHLITLSNILLKNGYEADQELENPDVLKKHISNIEIHHLCDFKKSILNNMIDIHLEIHHVIDVNWHIFYIKNNYDLTHSMLKSTCLNKVKNHTISTLSIENRLIVSMHHFARHLVANITGLAMNDCDHLFDCKTLLDAILLYHKYKNDLDFETLYKNIELYGFKDYIAIANKFIEVLFDKKIFDYERIYNLKDYKYNVWQSIISDSIVKSISPDFLFNEGELRFYQAVIEKCLSQNPIYCCEKVYKDKDYIYIDEFTESETKRRFGTVSREGLKPKGPGESNAKIRMKWDHEYLYMIFLVTDRCLKYYGETQKNVWSDGVTISIYNPNFSIINNNLIVSLMFNLAVDENGKKYVLITNNTQIRKKESYEGEIQKHKCKFEETSKGYVLYLKLNWQSLDIDVNNLTYLGMDIAINDVNSDDAVLDSVLCWSNPIKSYYCPAKFGRINLIT